MTVCRKCGASDNLAQRRGKPQTICRPCHAGAERARREAAELADPSIREARLERARASYRAKRQSLVGDLDATIRFWARQWRKTPRPGRDRSAVTQEALVALAYEALERFPYLRFLDRDRLGLTASVDQIKPSAGYTDDNIQVLPCWLNSAKMDMDEQTLRVLMDQYLQAVPA